MLKHHQDNNKLDLNSMIAMASEFATADDDAHGSLPALAIPTQAKKNNSNKRKNLPK